MNDYNFFWFYVSENQDMYIFMMCSFFRLYVKESNCSEKKIHILEKNSYRETLKKVADLMLHC